MIPRWGREAQFYANHASVVAEKPKFNVKSFLGRGREAQFYANHASVVAEKPKFNVK